MFLHVFSSSLACIFGSKWLFILCCEFTTTVSKKLKKCTIPSVTQTIIKNGISRNKQESGKKKVAKVSSTVDDSIFRVFCLFSSVHFEWSGVYLLSAYLRFFSSMNDSKREPGFAFVHAFVCWFNYRIDYSQ